MGYFCRVTFTFPFTPSGASSASIYRRWDGTNTGTVNPWEWFHPTGNAVASFRLTVLPSGSGGPFHEHRIRLNGKKLSAGLIIHRPFPSGEYSIWQRGKRPAMKSVFSLPSDMGRIPLGSCGAPISQRHLPATLSSNPRSTLPIGDVFHWAVAVPPSPNAIFRPRFQAPGLTKERRAEMAHHRRVFHWPVSVRFRSHFPESTRPPVSENFDPFPVHPTTQPPTSRIFDTPGETLANAMRVIDSGIKSS